MNQVDYQFIKSFCNDQDFIAKLETKKKFDKVIFSLPKTDKYNIATYLKLDKYFVDIVNKYPEIHSKFYIDWFEKYKNVKYSLEYKSDILEIIRNLLIKTEDAYLKNIKIIYCLIIFNILLTDIGLGFANDHITFKRTVENKILEKRF